MTFYLLALAIICVFPRCKLAIMQQPLWLCLMAMSVVSAFLDQYINEVGLLSIIIYSALYFAALNAQHHVLRFILTTLFILNSLALALHWVPGFNNLPIVINEHITPDAIAFTLYANVDKAMAGLFLCAYFYNAKNRAAKTSPKIHRYQPILITFTVVLTTVATALLLDLVKFDPKIPNFWLAFLAINLLFTCVGEEALFRGILQSKLSAMITPPRIRLFSVVITAAIFALAHFAGGMTYVFLSFLAGLGYGTIFYKTQRLEWAILCHWLVNVCHFFLFTYPMLATPS